jgi:hydrogenase large subunit
MAMGYASDGQTFAIADGSKPGIPKNGLIIRNLINGAEFVMSHITHFYHLAALDFVQGPPIAPWTPMFDNSYYVNALGPGPGVTMPNTADPVTEINDSITGGPTASIWGEIIADYVLALRFRRKAMEMVAKFAGVWPHMRTSAGGGVLYQPTQADIDEARSLLTEVRNFVDNHYIPLARWVTVLFPAYDNAANLGSGIGAGWGNMLAYGVFPESTGSVGAAEGPAKRLLARGYRLSGDATPRSLDHLQIEEFIANSKYKDDAADPYPKATGSRHPYSGYTNPDSAAGYNWSKAPRIMDGGPKAMEVGPLARMSVNGDYAPGTVIPAGFGNAHALPRLGSLGIPPGFTTGVSVMDRHRARALEAKKIADRMVAWLNELEANLGAPSIDTNLPLPTGTSGYGMHEAPRGALGHWLVSDSRSRISNYQCVVPTTWNVSPRDAAGNAGAIEKALEGTPISGVLSSGEQVAVEALRVIHSFDPCIACAVHIINGDGIKGKEVKR